MISAQYEVENQVSQRSRGLAKYEQDDDDQEEMVQVCHWNPRRRCKMWIHDEYNGPKMMSQILI